MRHWRLLFDAADALATIAGICYRLKDRLSLTTAPDPQSFSKVWLTKSSRRTETFVNNPTGELTMSKSKLLISHAAIAAVLLGAIVFLMKNTVIVHAAGHSFGISVM